MNKSLKNYAFAIVLLIIIFILITINFPDLNVIDNSDNIRKAAESVPQDLELRESSKDMSSLTSSVEEKPYILSCDPKKSKNLFEQLLEISDIYFLNSSIDEAEKRIALAKDYESRLTYILGGVYSGEFNVLDSLIELRNESTSSNLLDWNILNECSKTGKNQLCSNKLLNEIKTNLSANSAAWIAYGSIAIEAGNTEGIIESFQNIISAPNFNEYYSENVQLFDRVLEKHGASNSVLRYEQAFGKYAGASMPVYISTIVKFCRELSLEQSAIDLLCLEVGKRVATSSKSFVFESLGSTLQTTYYSKHNNKKAVEQVKHQQIKSRYYDRELKAKADTLSKYDMNLLAFAAQSVMEYGDIKANKVIIEEAIRLSSDKNYNPCQT